MRPAIVLAVAVVISGCTSSDVCHTIPIGSGLAGFERQEINRSSDYVFRAMVGPAEFAPFGRGSPSVWDNGPVAEAVCCESQQAGDPRPWCTAEQLSCAGPDFSDVKIYVLSAPYSDDSGAPDWANYCYVAATGNRIIAVWHRHWS